MFKHPEGSLPEKEVPEKKEQPAAEPKLIDSKVENRPDLRDLLEKNLKWSQIIYEQNRKINNKLLWSAIANWVRLGILILPFVLAYWFLPPLIRDFQTKYNFLFSTTTPAKTTSMEEILNILPLNEQQLSQLKAMLGTK